MIKSLSGKYVCTALGTVSLSFCFPVVGYTFLFFWCGLYTKKYMEFLYSKKIYGKVVVIV